MGRDANGNPQAPHKGVHVSQDIAPERVTATKTRHIWIVVAAIAGTAVLLFAGYGWARHQQLAAAEASLPARMELAGATESLVTKQYMPVLGQHSAPPFLGVIYSVTDGEAALADAEAQMAADDWTLVSADRGEVTTLQYEKDVPGISGVMVFLDDQDHLTVTITGEP